jgi:hypothetical protein
MSKLLALARAKNGRMKEELKKAKMLISTFKSKCEKLQSSNIERNQTIDNLRRQLAFYEGRFYQRLGVKKGHNSFSEGLNGQGGYYPTPIEQNNEFGGIESPEDDKMINISMLDQSNIMDISRVNKQSVMKRKRNNKGSIHLNPTPKECTNKGRSMLRNTSQQNQGGNFFKQQFLEEMSKPQTSNQELLEFEDIDHREAFKVEEAKGYLRQLAKELLMDINSRAKFTFSRMKNKKFIDFGLLPTPLIKIDKSVSCPPLSTSKPTRAKPSREADATLILDRLHYGNLGEDYSIDCDFDELKKLIMKHH